MAEQSPFIRFQAQLDEAAEILGLAEGTRQALRWPARELRVTLPVRMDDGRVAVFHGYRVQHSDARGPTRGGTRFHPDETFDTVRALAACVTWKAAVADLPVGGGAGGVACNPKALSAGELERLARLYVRQVGSGLGTDFDWPPPDISATPQIVAWMVDEAASERARDGQGAGAGTPLARRGAGTRDEATARGAVVTVREACARLGIDAANATYAIQGFGAAGQRAATLHRELLGGGRLVAVSDSRGGAYRAAGLDPEAVVRFKRETGSVVGIPGTEPIASEALLELKVDVLYPSACEGVITERNADRVNARLCCELASGPTTPVADRILHRRGVVVIPDVLAGAGAVAASHLEMIQDRASDIWPIDRVHERLDRTMASAFHAVADLREQLARRDAHARMRTAAYVLAVQRVAEAMALRGRL